MATTLGERIRARRQRKHWKLKDLAEKTGLSVPYLSDLERNESTNPTLETLGAISDALDCDVAELLGADSGAPGADKPLSVSLQRFLGSDDFNRQLKKLADRSGRPPDEELRREVVNFLANAPRRSSGELTRDDWKQLLNFLMAIADH